MINILADIAKDQKIVNALKKAVTDGTLLNRCPFDRNNQRPYCEKVCNKIWPDLSYCCPCNKPDREAIVIAIIAISKLYEKPYRYGDVFTLNSRLYILITVDGSNYSLVDPFTDDGTTHFWEMPVKLDKPTATISREEFKLISNGATFTYCGHISELTIKNGQLIK